MERTWCGRNEWTSSRKIPGHSRLAMAWNDKVRDGIRGEDGLSPGLAAGGAVKERGAARKLPSAGGSPRGPKLANAPGVSPSRAVEDAATCPVNGPRPHGGRFGAIGGVGNHDPACVDLERDDIDGDAGPVWVAQSLQFKQAYPVFAPGVGTPAGRDRPDTLAARRVCRAICRRRCGPMPGARVPACRFRLALWAICEWRRNHMSSVVSCSQREKCAV